MSSPSYAPANETAADLWLERSNFDGGILAGWAYGVMFTVFIFTLLALIKTIRHDKNATSGRLNHFFLVYIIIMFSLGTLFVACNSRFQELAYIDDRDFPGGPNNFTVSEYNNVKINLTGNVVFVIVNWLADGMLLYRCFTIWSHSFLIVAFPLLMYAASIGLGTTLCVQLARPDLSLWTHLTVSITLPYFSISLSLNMILTLLIVSRLLNYRLVQRRTLGAHHGSKYTSIAAMLIESAAIYSTFSLIFIISYARNSNVQNIFLPSLGEMQIVAPMLIIYRVASGSAWNARTAKETLPAHSIRFKAGAASSGSSSPRGLPGTGVNKSVTTATFQDDVESYPMGSVTVLDKYVNDKPNSVRS